MHKMLEMQSDRIKAVLSMHKVHARVTGGTVTSRWTRFQVLSEAVVRISRIRALHEELAAALDASTCRVSRRGAAVTIEVPRDDPRPVHLLPLFRQLSQDGDGISPATAILGLSEEGVPLLVRLPFPDVAHVLVAGTTGSDEAVLLRTMILSLALTNPAPSLFSSERRRQELPGIGACGSQGALLQTIGEYASSGTAGHSGCGRSDGGIA